MRLSFAVVAALTACSDVTIPSRVFVSKVPSGVHVAREEGDPLKLTRWEMDPRAGLSRGYWVVRSEREWRDLWSGRRRPNPAAPARDRLQRARCSSSRPRRRRKRRTRGFTRSSTRRRGESTSTSRRSFPASGARLRADDRVPVDLARVRSLDKEVHFHVDTKNEDPCAPPSEAKIACRVDGTTDTYQEKLSVDPGKTVSCRSQGKLGSRAMVDRTWSFRALPNGTVAKMTVAEGGGGSASAPMRSGPIRLAST